MTCFECGEGTMVPRVVDLTGERNSETFLVRTDGLQCDHCAFATIDNNQTSQFTRLVSDAYRKKHGLLTGVEIRARRLRLGMSQQEFAAYLGPGIASVKRWELGQIQDKAMDELIRLKTDPEAARKNLRALEQQFPEPMVVSESDNVELTLILAEAQYVKRPAMNIETVSIPDEEFSADACIAA